MSNSKQRKNGALLSYVSIIVSTIVQLLYTPFLIRMLGNSEYGLYSLIYSIIGYLTVLDLGFGNALVVYTTKYRAQQKYEEEKKLHGMFFIMFCIMGIISAIFGIILYFSVDKLFGLTMSNLELFKAKIMILILTFNILITFVFNVYTSIITAYEKYIYQKIITIINTILKPLLMIPFLLMGYKSITMCITITIVNAIVMISNYLYCKNKIGVKVKYLGFDKKTFKEIFSYSFFIFIAIVVDKLNWSVDQFVLGAVSGTLAVSLYSVAAQINNMFINLSTAISGVLLPKMSEMVAKNATSEDITKEFIKVGRIQYYIVFLMASGITLFGKEFFVAWVGKEYIMSYYIAIILIIPLCIPLIQNLGLSIMQAKNLHKFRSILLLLISIGNIIVSVPLAKLYGGIGSAIGTSLTLIIGNIIIMNIYYHKKVGINMIKFWKEIIKMAIPCIIPIMLIEVLKNIIKLEGFTHLIVFGGIYTLIYCIVCYKHIMNEYEKNIISNIIKR